MSEWFKVQLSKSCVGKPTASSNLALSATPRRAGNIIHGMGRVASVNVGEPRPVQYRGHAVMTAIWKAPVAGRVALRGVNLAGDRQADLRVHGGPDKAVYAYAVEDLAWWAVELERGMEPGVFGENLTTSGIDVTQAVVGERWRIGETILEVAQPRSPCFKLGIRMGDQKFIRRFLAAERPGAYLRVLNEGDIGAGDTVEVVGRPLHGVTIREVNHALMIDPAGAARLLLATELPEPILEWARQEVDADASPP